MSNPTWIKFVGQLFSTFPGTSSLVVGFLQILGIAIGVFAIKTLLGRDIRCLYAVCLSAIIAAIMILPLHLAHVGWKCTVPFEKHSAPIAVASTRDAISDPTSDPSVPSPSRSSREAPPIDDTYSWGTNPSASLNTADSSIASRPNPTWSTLQISIAIYLGIVMIQLLRTARGWLLLRHIARRGTLVSGTTQLLVEDCRKRIGILDQVSVLRSKEVAMPLTFGIIRPTVLVPNDFQEWTTLEQKAVALHEFSHIARRDMIGEFLVRLMHSLYWLHPASYWVAKQLRMAREAATDQRVISTGFLPYEYARCLVQILDRENTQRVKNVHVSPSIGMSTYGNMEFRLNSIFHGVEKMNTVRGVILIAGLFLFATISMVRLEAVPLHAGKSQSDETASPTMTVPPETNLDRPQRNDLFDLIMNTPIENDIHGDNDVEINVSGIVLAPSGEPARGCTVVLRHLDQKRYLASLHNRDHSSSLLARTTSDEDGRYKFTKLRVPKESGPPRQAWSGHILAGHNQLGIGWESFVFSNENRTKSEINIRLSKAISIEGRCVNDDGTVAERTSVLAYSMAKIGDDGHQSLGLVASDLEAESLTDANGKFQFANFPENSVVFIYARGTGATSKSFFCSSDDHGLTPSNFEPFALLPKPSIQSNPVLLKLQKSIQIPVRVVDIDGRPVAGGRLDDLSGKSGKKSDQQGMLVGSVDPSFFEQESSLRISFEKDSPYLDSTRIKVSRDSIIESKPIDVVVEKGTRVRGRIVTKEGLGATGVGIQSDANRVSEVDSEGNFELKLPKKSCRLIFCSLAGEHRLPSLSQCSEYFWSESELPSHWTFVDVDATKGEDIALPPLTIQRAAPIQVVATLPNGKPASNAVATITDISISKSGTNTRFEKLFLTETFTLDNDGIASISSQGLPSNLASVEVRLIQDNIPYLGIASLDSASHGKTPVRMTRQWRIHGRVLLDGQPVQGAWVHALKNIGRKSEVLRPESVLHCGMPTNHLGEYEFIMPRDGEYEIQVSSMPQDHSICIRANTRDFIRRSDVEMEVPEFRIERGTESISGSVVNLRGEPVIGARIFRALQDHQKRPWIGESKTSSIRTDDQGRFVLHGLPRGSFRLSAHLNALHKTFSSTEVATHTGEANVRLVLPTSEMKAEIQ